MKWVILLSPFLGLAVSSKELFSIPEVNSRSAEPCCDKNTLSCFDVEVDPESLHTENGISINGLDMAFSNIAPPHAFVYKTDLGDEAVISYNEETGNVFGTLKTHDGKSFALEKCGNNYIFEEFDLKSFPTEKGEPLEEALTLPEDRQLYNSTFNSTMNNTTFNSTMNNSTFNFKMMNNTTFNLKMNNSTSTSNFTVHNSTSNFTMDRNDIVTYSVMVYYTAEFAAITPNIRDYVDQVIAETNQGYINSLIPVRIKLHCTELAPIEEVWDGSDMLTNFIRMKEGSYDETRFSSKYAALRNTADSAVLLIKDFEYCGIGYVGTYANGFTFSVSIKSCALGYLTFGHELGHNFGAHHDPAADTNGDYAYGHGHLIQPTGDTKWSGYRTIMAYFSNGHYEKVNYYSNPKVNYPGTGTPTGVARISNNAKVITRNRHSFAGLGDESGVCNDGFSTTITTTTIAPNTTTTASTEGCNENQIPTLKTIRRKRSVETWSQCRDFCNDNAECEYFQWRNSEAVKDRICFMKKGMFKNKKGWTSGTRFCGLEATNTTASNTTTPASTEGCNENQIPSLKTIKRKRSVETWSQCRDFCNDNSECEYFQWRNSEAVKD